ncbi:MAG: hypothetical protein H6673_03525 [Anaerolineales bacterium]|nr:hypothetical protein [Anaerolineales bacterium]
MKTAFLSVSYKHRSQLEAEFTAINTSLRKFDVQPIDFVTTYRFELGQEREMMALSCALIRAANLLIAEVTHKAIGVGVEVGFAAALGIPIIYARHAEAEYSTTIGGVATYNIAYHHPAELMTQLANLLEKLGI